MRASLVTAFFLGVVTLSVPPPAPACNLCGAYAKRSSFVNDYWQAPAAVCGTLANPKLNDGSGAGTTEFHVDKTLKGDPRLKGADPIIIPRYLTVLNPKDPPRMILLLDQKLVPFAGKDYTPAFADYLAGSEAVREKSRAQALTYFARYLDHTDQAVADDAFLQFAQAGDREILDVAPTLKPDVFRRLVKDPKVDSERLSLFAFLLGATGVPADADLLFPLLQKPDDRSTKALEGIAAGYILRRPKEGWAWTNAVLADPRQPFLVRWGVVRAVRFLYGARPADYRAQVLQVTALMVPNGELADIAVGDLQKWRLWDHTALILQQYGKPSHSAPIVRNSILRYALACPLPEARKFIAEVRRREPAMVRDLEDDLAFEKGS